MTCEQEPSLNSYIGLGGKTDRFGLKQADLHWEISPTVWLTIVRFARAIASELARLGLGTAVLHSHITANEPDWSKHLSDVNHHMGGTRMSSSRNHGVVNQNLQVWGIKNLFICSCSVFPTGSHSNPTHTLLALALRLADHLRACPGKGLSGPRLARFRGLSKPLCESLGSLRWVRAGTNLKAILRFSSIPKRRREVEDSDGKFAAQLTAPPERDGVIALHEFQPARSRTCGARYRARARCTPLSAIPTAVGDLWLLRASSARISTRSSPTPTNLDDRASGMGILPCRGLGFRGVH